VANCADCGKDLDEMDMAMGACQGQDCGEMLTPDTIQVLREAFGQVQVSPDIAPPPVAGPDIPDGVVCENPDCGMDLMGDQMAAYEAGQPCPYCTVAKTSAAAPAPVQDPTAWPEPRQPPSAVSVGTPQSSTAPVDLLVNSGPLAKHNVTITLPTDQIIGRSVVKQQLHDACAQYNVSTGFYDKAISRISREHCKLYLNPASGNLIVEDMGSTNHTYVDREQVVAGTSVEIGHHQMLVLAGRLYLIRPGQLPIIHTTTGVRLFFVGPQTLPPSISSPAAIHLGRLQLDGSHETFAKAIMETMEDDPALDPDDFRRVSRRHATLALKDGEYTLTVEEGKTGKVIEFHPSVTGDPITSTVDSSQPKSFAACQGGVSIVLGREEFRIE